MAIINFETEEEMDAHFEQIMQLEADIYATLNMIEEWKNKIESAKEYIDIMKDELKELKG